MLKLNRELATSADNIASGITEAGKYIGTITRAEKLSSDKGTEGLGISFKTDSGQTADYLDLWHTKGNGEALSSLKTVNAILCCAKVFEANDGMIQCEKWNRDHGVREKVSVPGYPDLMGKRIGFLFQKVLETDERNGKEREKLQIFGVFNADTELTASEMFTKKTNPERLSNMLDALLARPVRDNRKGGKKPPAKADHSEKGRPGNGFDDMEDDIPF